MSVKDCEVRRARPTKDGHVELEYRLNLSKPGAGGGLTAMIIGKAYRDESGEKKFKKLLVKFETARVLCRIGLEWAGALRSGTQAVASFSFNRREAQRVETRARLGGNEANSVRSSQYFPGWGEISSCEIDILRYRPGRRCILSYRLTTRDSQTRRVIERVLIGKVYRERGEDTFRVMRDIEDRGFGKNCRDGIRIPRALGYDRELKMLLMEEVSGYSMTKSFLSPRLVDHLSAAGRALAKLHASPLKPPGTHRAEDAVTALKRWVDKAVQINPGLSGSFEQGLTRITESSKEIHCHETVLVHGDYYHKQILAGAADVAIVDFDTLCDADPAIDIGNFLAHLKCKGVELGWSEREDSRYAETFLEAYCRCMPADLTRRTDFYYRASLLRIACLVSLRPKKRHLTAALLAEVAHEDSHLYCPGAR